VEAIRAAFSGWYVVDGLGFIASGATLIAFAQKRMWPMRMAAIASNVCFIGYGALGLVYPVLALQLILLPLNIRRLIEHRTAISSSTKAGGNGREPTLVEEWRHRKRLSRSAMSRARKAIPSARPISSTWPRDSIAIP